MPQKVILVADPGIDTAFAVALAFIEPKIDVLALAATAGNVKAFQATTNVHTLVAQLDPAKWPRLGAAPQVEYEIDGTRLHGVDGLGNADLPSVSLHSPPSSDRLIVEIVRQFPKEVTLVCMGPLTVVARAFSRDPGIAEQLDRVICVGGCWREAGNAGPMV